jgi:hypothetical protein
MTTDRRKQRKGVKSMKAKDGEEDETVQLVQGKGNRKGEGATETSSKYPFKFSVHTWHAKNPQSTTKQTTLLEQPINQTFKSNKHLRYEEL